MTVIDIAVICLMAICVVIGVENLSHGDGRIEHIAMRVAMTRAIIAPERDVIWCYS